MAWHIVSFSLVAFMIGFGSMWATRAVVRRRLARMAERDAQDFLEAAEWQAKRLEAEASERAKHWAEEQQAEAEAELAQLEQRIEALNQKAEDKEEALKASLQSIEKSLNRVRQEVDSYEKKVRHREVVLGARRDAARSLRQEWRMRLEERSGLDCTATLAELRAEVLTHAELETSRLLQRWEEEIYQESEKNAKRVIARALNRFNRPYCPERGTGFVAFADEKAALKVRDPDLKIWQAIEKACGVDLVFDAEQNSATVSGFDPVRREWAKLVIEQAAKENEISPEKIAAIAQKTRTQLLARIRDDGLKLAKEMGLTGLHAEITNMMGALRYRYSFTQNQYFHCGEVGFLCGLLAGEIGLEVKTARRAGMLHDIGKAMDHSREGGHAVIGADFIEQNGESREIVHAVRAHHYDEAPETELAHLVIAADALSGARPGARRSTAASYIQKMEDLLAVANSFPAVIDTHVLSAGREVRVMVDGKQTDDWAALRLSREIAKKIEAECAYPGQIKVTVVRETQAIDFAR